MGEIVLDKNKISGAGASLLADGLAKLQTRNIEIQKRKAAGKDFNDILPDNLKSGAPPEMAKRKSTVEEVEKHADEVAKDLPPPPAEEAPEAAVEGGEGEAPTEAPAAEGEAKEDA